MIRFILILIIGALLVSSCRSTRKIQSAIAVKKDTVEVVKPTTDPHQDSIKFIKDNYYQLLANRIEFETFSAKINTDYEGSDGKKYDVNVFIRMKKDSLIWISVNGALGIEGMRVLIDKDSVRILNKLDKEYQVRSLEYLTEVAALPLDLRTVQELIIGNPVFLDTNIVSYSTEGNKISLLSEGQWFRHLISMNNNDHLVLHSKLDDVDILRNRTCFLTYSEYETGKGVKFSTNRTISVTEKNKLDVKLNFKQYAFNETLSYPFSVPKNYKKKL
ncbi:MAG TPA: DUF4292 domain-containing protein [Chitinophagaceae bacterium]|jgi:hypothetical protein|nr:DUF4292 domain-containing protein [Chitinophagaceae bacterium]